MNSRRCSAAVSLLLLLAAAPAPADEPEKVAAGFTRQVLTREYLCDGINAGDFNRDGILDVVAGPYWYEGPRFQTRHDIFPATPQDAAKGQSNSMFSYVYDFNSDGWPDVLVLGRVHLHPARWFENPRGGAGLWAEHFAFERVRGESPPFVDSDGDGRPELFGHWENRWGRIAPDWTAVAQPWRFEPITGPGDFNQFYHGTGVGDVNGDGRLDLILNEGWWEQPKAASAAGGASWVAHPQRFGERGGAQMFVDDVDGDGDGDIITALDAHSWGLAWFEQDRQGGEVRFHKHPIMGDRSEEARYGASFSQPHALDLADVDGDGLKDIVTGKRRWAHGPAGDVEPGAAPVLYWFQLVRGPGRSVSYRPHLIDDSLGVGVQVIARDINGDGATDILTASKLGSAVYTSTLTPRKPPPGP